MTRIDEIEARMEAATLAYEDELGETDNIDAQLHADIAFLIDRTRELEEQLKQSEKLLDAYRLAADHYEEFARSCIENGEPLKSFHWFVNEINRFRL